MIRRSFVGSGSSVALVLVAFGALAQLGCSSADEGSGGSTGNGTVNGPSNGPNGSNGGNGNTAASGPRVRVVHGSPDAPAVDVYVRGQTSPIFSSVAYQTATAFATVPEGKYVIELRAAGAKPTEPPAYTSAEIALPSKGDFTVIAAGLLTSTKEEDKFRLLPLAESFGASASDKIRIRVVHGSANAPAVGLDVGNDDPTKPEVASLERFKDTGADGIELPAGRALQVGVVAAGKTVTAFTTPALPAGTNLIAVASGLLGKKPNMASAFSLIALGPGGTSAAVIKQNPVVYALHASPNAPAVDIFAGPAKIVQGAKFGMLSGAIQVPPGSYTLDFFPAAAAPTRPQDKPVVSSEPLAVEAGETYLAAASGFLSATTGQKPFQVLAIKDGFMRDDQTKGLVRIVHACGDAPAVDIGPLAMGTRNVATKIFTNLAFGNATESRGTALAKGTYDLGVAVTPSATAAKSFMVPVDPANEALVIAAGSLAATPSQPNSFRLLVVDTAKTPWTLAATVTPAP